VDVALEEAAPAGAAAGKAAGPDEEDEWLESHKKMQRQNSFEGDRARKVRKQKKASPPPPSTSPTPEAAAVEEPAPAATPSPTLPEDEAATLEVVSAGNNEAATDADSQAEERDEWLESHKQMQRQNSFEHDRVRKARKQKNRKTNSFSKRR